MTMAVVAIFAAVPVVPAPDPSCILLSIAVLSIDTLFGVH